MAFLYIREPDDVQEDDEEEEEATASAKPKKKKTVSPVTQPHCYSRFSELYICMLEFETFAIADVLYACAQSMLFLIALLY